MTTNYNTDNCFTTISPSGDIYFLSEEDRFVNEEVYRNCIESDFELIFRNAKSGKLFNVIFTDGKRASCVFDGEINCDLDEIAVEMVVTNEFGLICNYCTNRIVEISLWKIKFEDGISCSFELNRDFQETLESFLEGFGLHPKRAFELSKIINRFKMFYEKCYLSII